MRKFAGKLTHQGIGWRIYEEPNAFGGIYRTADTSCRSCQSRPRNPSPLELVCENPRCSRNGKTIKLSAPLSDMLRLVVNMWEGEQNRKEGVQFVNFDQELVPLAKGKDSDDDYWCRVKVLQTDQGKMAMVLIGRSGHESKVQFFIKDELNQVTFDQVGDLNPSELLLSFKAQFSDGATTATEFGDTKARKKKNKSSA